MIASPSAASDPTRSPKFSLATETIMQYHICAYTEQCHLARLLIPAEADRSPMGRRLAQAIFCRHWLMA